ncbi:Conserved_hypothetical protein [Hexamita inflata]|uniref:Uncharacterized protein n=1 Tax=Hexamita inflata TaxID=28002 RepID=A0AA86R4E2_9EUKA|nr:Conserved hypothetical protein [Hexamita inflata]
MQNQKSIEEDTNQANTLKDNSLMKITIQQQCEIAQIVKLSAMIQELDIGILCSTHNLEDCKLENLKILRIKELIQFDKQWNWILKLCKHSKLQELSVWYYQCSIQNIDAFLFLNSIKKLTLTNCGFQNLDILIPCANLQEYDIIEYSSKSQLKDNSLLIKKWYLLNNIDFVQNLDVKQLIICNCAITNVKLCNQTLKELEISDCKLEQLDIQKLTNLEVLKLKSQSLDMNTLSLLMVTELKRLREICLSGYDLGISLLLNIESIQKISLHKCTNIDLKQLNTSIIELSIIDCKFQSNDLDLSHYPKLEVLKLKNEYMVNKNITNLTQCSKLKVLYLSNQWTLNIFQQLMQSSNVRLPRNMTHIMFFQEIFHLNDLNEVDIQLNNTLQIPRDGILTINNQKIERLEFLQIFDIYKLVLYKCKIRVPIELNNCIKELTLKDCVLHSSDLQSYNLEVLQICNCAITNVKLCNQTLKELEISDCTLEQLDIQKLTNLEVLKLKSQSLDMNTLSLLMVTELKRLREICLSGYDLGISLLLNIESIQKISLHKCTNIDLKQLNTSIIELSIIDCKFQSNDLDLSHYPKLEVLKLKNENKYIFDDKVKVDNIKIINLDLCSKIQKLILDGIKFNILENLKPGKFDLRLAGNCTTIDFIKLIFNMNDLEKVEISSIQISHGILTINNQKIERLEFLQIFDIYKLVLYKCKIRVPIELNNCIKELTLKDCVLHSSDLQSYNLEVLQICNCAITNVKLCNQTLKELEISDCTLKQLDIIYFDLPNLEILNLRFERHFEHNKQNYIHCNIKRLSKLRELTIIENRGFDIYQLQNFKYLTKLTLNGCSIKNIDVLRRLKNLKELNLAANNIIYLDPLQQLTQLSYLNVYGNNIHDFSAIQGHYNFKNYNMDNQGQIWDYLLQNTNMIQKLHAPITLINDMSVKRCNLKKKLHNTEQILKKFTEHITYNQIQFLKNVVALFRLVQPQNYDDIQ